MNTINLEIDRVFFDTHANIKKLRDAGFREKEAEALTEILSQLIKDDLVTKDYFALKMKELDSRLRELEARLETKMAKLEVKIIVWVAGLLVAQTGIIVTLIKLLPSIN